MKARNTTPTMAETMKKKLIIDGNLDYKNPDYFGGKHVSVKFCIIDLSEGKPLISKEKSHKNS